MNRLSDADLRYLTEVDHRDHEAIVALRARAADPVGVARYVRIEAPTEAEVAVAVVDDWQGRGAATALLERLVERARENGIERFVAVVLQENARGARAVPEHRPRRADAAAHRRRAGRAADRAAARRRLGDAARPGAADSGAAAGSRSTRGG